MVDTAALAYGGDPDKRSAMDFYPTPIEVTHALMMFLSDVGHMPSMVWECACGGYDMSKVIEEYTSCIATDLKHGQDYLNHELPEGVDSIITNPPFSLAEQFIRKALSETPVVAMLLKSSYWHASKRAALFNKHRPAYILPLLWRPQFSPLENAGSPTMDVLWTVWLPDRITTQYELLSKPVLTGQMSMFGK